MPCFNRTLLSHTPGLAIPSSWNALLHLFLPFLIIPFTWLIPTHPRKLESRIPQNLSSLFLSGRGAPFCSYRLLSSLRCHSTDHTLLELLSFYLPQDHQLLEGRGYHFIFGFPEHGRSPCMPWALKEVIQGNEFSLKVLMFMVLHSGHDT